MESGSPEKYSRQDLIDLFKKEPFVFAPGERWAYSNSNYTLLGVIIEKVSGKGYEQFLQETLFSPLGMTATHSCGTRPTGELFAKGYMPVDGSFTPAPPVNMNTAVADGGLCSSVQYLLTWTRAYYKPRRQQVLLCKDGHARTGGARVRAGLRLRAVARPARWPSQGKNSDEAEAFRNDLTELYRGYVTPVDGKVHWGREYIITLATRA